MADDLFSVPRGLVRTAAAPQTTPVDRREMQLIAAKQQKQPVRTREALWPDPYAPRSPDGVPLDEGKHWTGDIVDAPKEYGGGKAYPMEDDAPGALKFDGKYPKDFVRLYNIFLNDYVKRPGDIAKERQSEDGSGPLTDRMEQLDSFKNTMDYVRENPEGRQLKKLPLGMQDYIASSPSYQEWEAQLPPGTPRTPWGFNPLGEPWGPPSNEGYMRPGYKGRA